ncbi:MAG: PolyA polymerase [Candidatus Kaiserbacteria bacterium GW2011_GWC2_52_8b]|uniref:PolyA polymerase n=3 Tax=Candidatus Kaiseribacteriota TaxID=1752734 RepID=A0A0G1ZTP8_9BACT|nr:MAG: PolyA polymerase [Candidatus Kaiserbacteria bacterium GW2011_GWC2_52_8b]
MIRARSHKYNARVTIAQMNVSLIVPQEVKNLSQTLKKAGFGAYLVGGCVRDLLIEREPKDWDITTNATPEEIQKLFKETFYENKYGTVGVVTESADPRLKVIEITPYRIEGKYSNRRHPDEVHFSDKLSNDLKRRDFTINAIAYDVEDDTFVDEHGGREDLARKIIKTVGVPHERFEEDALRMLRAVRISAELDFAIDTQTAAGIATHATLLKQISQERIRDELIRILLSPRPMQALYVAQKLGILSSVIPELMAAIGIDQNQAHSYDVFEHSLRALQHAADKNWSLEIRLAALLHDIGKPATRLWSDDKKDWTFHGHEVVGAKIARKILNDLRFPKETIDTVIKLIRWHMFFSDPDKVTLSAVRRVITNVGTEHIKDLLNMRICDRVGTGRPKEQPFRLRKYMSMVDEALRDPVSVAMLKIGGSHIIEVGLEKAGPRIGWILHALLEEVLDEPQKNTSDYLEKRTQEMSKLNDEELKKLGEAGKDRKAEEDEAAIRGLREKHHVS